MVLAKIYGVSSISFGSKYGDDFLDYDAVLPSQENEFSKDNFISLEVKLDPNCSDGLINHSLNVRCRHFTPEEVKSLEGCATCEENGERYLHLILWEDDLSRHGLRTGHIVDIDMLPMKLSQVILTAKYDKKHAQDLSLLLHGPEHFLFDKVMSVGNQRFLELQHEGQAFKVELEVKHCEPVSQGTTDLNTKWVIIDASYEDSLECIGNTCQSNASVDIKDNPLPLLIADFVSPLKDLWDENLQDKTKRFRIEVEYWNDLHLAFMNSIRNEWKFDEHDTHCIYVSMETLMELQVHNGSWVKVWLHKDTSKNNIAMKGTIKFETTCIQTMEEEASNCSTSISDRKATGKAGSSTCYYVQLLAITPIEKALNIYIPKAQQIQVLDMDEYIMKARKTVHVSSVVMFNLLQSVPNNDSSELFLNLDTETMKFAKHDLSNTTSVSFAQDAHLSLIKTPFTNPGDAFDESLKRHFFKPRLLTVGDVLCVNFDSKKDSVNSLMVEENRNLRTIYFKVKRLVVSGKDESSGLVDTDHTTVYQTTSVHSFVPTYTQSFVNKSNYWLLKTPPGLHEPTRELINIIKPYLKEHVNMMPAVLLTGPKGVGKTTVFMAIGRLLGVCVMNINCYDMIGESMAATESRVNNLFQKAMNSRPCLLLLRNIDILVKDRDGLEDEPRVASTLMQCIANLKEVTMWPVVVIATSSSSNPLSTQLYSCFLHEVSVQTPAEPQRRQIIEALASMCQVDQDVSFGLVSKKTAGLVLADIVSLFTKAAKNACERLSKKTQINSTEQEDFITVKEFDNKYDEGLDERFDAKINRKDFEEAIETIRAEHSDTIGAPKIPNVLWQDIGGLMDVKEELLDTIQLPLQHPELFASGLRRSGVLLYGPPGTGKTLLAKAVATECSLNFLSVKGPELINMYVGQSEQNVRQVFSRAQSATPCVIFFDELDSLAPNRGRSGDSGGVMDRVVSQLLAELDGLHKSCDVFVIGATNRPDLLDPALLRPGRFDKLLYLGISEDHEAQLKILQALTKKFELDPGCQLQAISNECPLNFTGADLYALCSDAMLNAIKRTVADQPGINNETETRFCVKQEDFLEALHYLTPSVSEHELQRYKKIQQQLLT